MEMNVGWAAGLLLALSMPAPAWAELGKLVRQETRPTASGSILLVCIYSVSGREVERVYPLGNFCPRFVEA